MSALKVLIVDDEPPARKKIRSFLKQSNTALVVMEADNGIAAVNAIKNQMPDLVLLDIQMPGMTGFEVIEAVGIENMPPVIFVTAYDQYAIAAFEVQAVDYLLKPFDFDRLQKSLSRVLAHIEAKKDNIVALKNLLQQIKTDKKYLDRIMVSVGSRYFFINTADILYLSSEDKSIKLHTANDSYLVRDTIANLEGQLDSTKFARIHRSHIINLEFVKEIQPWSHGDYIVIMKSGVKLNMSRRFKDRVFGE